MEALLTGQQMQLADKHTIESVGIPSLDLMEKAALATVEVLVREIPDKNSPGIILCGRGNNGGDALAVARLLSERGYKKFEVLTTGETSVDAQAQKKRLDGLGVKTVTEIPDSVWSKASWIVDGLFGTGLKREVTGTFADLIEKVNRCVGAKCFSIDIPSGLCSDTGNILGVAVRANYTITFGFLKRGMLTGHAADHVGAIRLDTISIPREIPKITPSSYWFQASDAASFLPERSASGHKGNYGHVYVWAGVEETEGAAGLAGLAAYRSGCGLCTLVGDHDLSGLRSRLPVELMAKRVDAKFFGTLKQNDVLVMGPGMGMGAQSWEILKAAFKSSARLVLDADAITVISMQKGASSLLKARNAPTVLTPHPKEASRLLDCEVEEIQRDRYSSAKEIAQKFGTFVLLKGRGTIVAVGEEAELVVTSGNSSLSKGGSGDILSGILGAFCGQAVPSKELVALAAFVHGRAAEVYSAKFGTERSLLASELTEMLPIVFSELEKK